MRLPSDRHFFLLIFLFAIEAIVFYRVMIVEIAPFYPAQFDQLSYYLETYSLIDRVQTAGWWAMIDEYIRPRSAVSIQFTTQGALLGILFGANRTVIIGVNFIHFVALQLVLFYSVRGRTNRWDLAWFSVAVLLSCATIFIAPGGIYDYRVDFSALCLYGIWTCLLIRDQAFSSTKHALMLGAVGVLLVTMRFFTVIDVAAVLGGLLAYVLIVARSNSARYTRALAIRRARNIVISGAMTAVVALPILYLARVQIYDYYIVGHLLSDERYIRARELNLFTILDHILFYPKSILGTHIGFGWSMCLLLMLPALAAAGSILPRRALPQILIHRLKGFGFELFTLGLAILCPLAVLTIDIAKSPVVGGIVVVPIVLLIVLLIAAMLPATQIAPWSRSIKWLAKLSTVPIRSSKIFVQTMMVVIALGIGLVTFISRASIVHHPMSRADLTNVTVINESIDRYVIDHGLSRPTFSFDRIADYLNWGTVRLFGYEHFHQLIDFDPLFGHSTYGIFATPRDIALQLVAKSDIVILTDPVRGREAPYPMNTKIQEYWDEMWTWTTQNRVLLMSVDINGIPHRVFVRPSAGTNNS